MFQADQYQLLDFADHCKLESFSGVQVSRDTPSVQSWGDPAGSDWPEADVTFNRTGPQQGDWHGIAPDPWILELGNTDIRMELKLTPSGQVGVFPEQADNWEWFLQQGKHFSGRKGLNLFAYTGGSTLSLARCGAEMTHVDSARSVVNWARHNAQLSDLGNATIRWIVEDAVRYVGRELKRGNRYDILIADPPSFGRGPKGETWKLEKDLQPLLNSMAALASDELTCILISCHTPGVGHLDLFDACFEAFSGLHRFRAGTAEAFELAIPCSRKSDHLKSGVCFRWFS